MLLNSWITRRLLTAQVEDVTIIRMAIESPTCLNRIPVPPFGAEYIQRRRRDCHIPVKSSVRILIHNAGLHDEDDAADARDVFYRIAVEGDDVRLQAGSDGTNLVRHAEGFGGERVGRNHGSHRIDSAVPDTADEIFGVVTVRASDGIAAEDNLQPWRFVC